ncbi:tetratricopeptide repeat protein [Vreelandella jeotgali]|uniref:tetratricopeptide repeat protein n=1 Tax=Vreelandella jeotgali TaxID=553386 RepID=UPI00034BE9DA|nr:hypothetical protein [Halomonas jeotgali]
MTAATSPGREALDAFADSLTPLTTPQLLQKGRELLKAKRLHEAAALYFTLINHDPHCMPGYLHLMRLLKKARRPDAVEQILRRGLTALPDEPLLWKALVNHALKNRSGGKARQGLQQLDRLEPGTSSTLGLHAQFELAQGHLQQALPLIRRAVEQRAATPPPAKDVDPSEPFDIEANTRTLWTTLAALHKAGVHAFPCFGTLLGLERDGHLMPHDKDMDLGLPHNEMNAAIVVMQEAGWTETPRTYPGINPRAFSRDGIVIDLFGFIHDAEANVAYTGIWMKGVPFHDNLVHRFAPIHLHTQRSEAGLYWQLQDPHAFLAAHYGPWQQLDTAFASFAEDRNATGMTPLREYFVWTRVLKDWNADKIPLLQRYLASMREWQPDDPLLPRLARHLDADTASEGT